MYGYLIIMTVEYSKRLQIVHSEVDKQSKTYTEHFHHLCTKFRNKHTAITTTLFIRKTCP